MDCPVIISPRAIQDLREIVRYVSFEDSAAAERLGNALMDAALSLGTLPERGRLVPEFNDGRTREVIYRPYRIIYRFDPASNAIVVSRFWHGARLLNKNVR